MASNIRYSPAVPSAGQVALPKTAADVMAPATGIIMHPEYAKVVG